MRNRSLPSIALKGVLFLALFDLVGAPTMAKEVLPNLSCEQNEASLEASTMMQAPNGARRLEQHVLEVISKNAKVRFVDKPPHDEGGLSGVHWRYCGFDPHAKVHLIGMTDNGLFSGELFFEDSGTRARAGQAVVFARNQRDYLAIEQESGMDGALWSVYDGNGTVLWKGYAGTIQKIQGIDSVISTFERPRWNRQGRLTAHFACTASQSKGVVTLTPSSSGWRWLGHAKCPIG